MAWDLGSGEPHDNLLCVSLTLKELLGVMNTLNRTRLGRQNKIGPHLPLALRGN